MASARLRDRARLRRPAAGATRGSPGSTSAPAPAAPSSASTSTSAATSPRGWSSASRCGCGRTSTTTWAPGDVRRAVEAEQSGRRARRLRLRRPQRWGQLRRGRGRLEEWGAERLAAGRSARRCRGPRADRSAFEPLRGQVRAAAARRARVLGRRHLDLADPPPGYGMFAHVSLAALAARVEPLLAD